MRPRSGRLLSSERCALNRAGIRFRVSTLPQRLPALENRFRRSHERRGGNLKFAAGETGARIVLYSGEAQREPLVHYGPFAAGSVAEIEEMFRRYRAGRFESMSAIARRARQSSQPVRG